MKNISKYIFFIILNCCFININNAQSNKAEDTSYEILFPPLEDLIDAAIKHNSMVKFRNLGVDVKESLVKTEKNYWTRNFGFQGDLEYGNLNNSSYSVEENNPSLLTTSTTQFNYGVGVYLKFPIFDYINRKDQIKQAKIEVDQAKSMAEAQENEIRLLVINQYHNVILKQKLLNINSQNLGSAKVNLEMVEKEFTNGIIAVSEYVRISDMTSKIQVEYEISKSEFLLAKIILENTVGITFNKTY